MSFFHKIANAQGHKGYRSENIFAHTSDEESSNCAVQGYLTLLHKVLNHMEIKKTSAIDIGCGAGYITNAFHKNNFTIKGLEYSEDALNIAHAHNSHLDIFQGDMSQFKENNTYDFIFSREVYLITRINAFTEQKEIISNIIDSLKPEGIFMLVGSDVSFPDCMDYDLIIKTFRKDSRLQSVSNMYYEFIFRKFNKFIFGSISYFIIKLFLYPLILYKKYKYNFATPFIIVFVKK